MELEDIPDEMQPAGTQGYYRHQLHERIDRLEKRIALYQRGADEDAQRMKEVSATMRDALERAEKAEAELAKCEATVDSWIATAGKAEKHAFEVEQQIKAYQDNLKWCSVCSGGWTDGPTCPYCDRRLFQKQVEQDEKDRQVWLKESEGCVRSVNALARQRDELMEQIAILKNALESSGEQCGKWERRARDEHETNVRLEAKLKQAEEDLDYYKGLLTL